MRSDGDDVVGVHGCATPDHIWVYFDYFIYLFFCLFPRRWIIRFDLARWIQIDLHALDLFDC
jgi:hypothetical protein